VTTTFYLRTDQTDKLDEIVTSTHSGSSGRRAGRPAAARRARRAGLCAAWCDRGYRGGRTGCGSALPPRRPVCQVSRSSGPENTATPFGLLNGDGLRERWSGRLLWLAPALAPVLASSLRGKRGHHTSGRHSRGIVSPGRAGVRSWTAGDASSGADRCGPRPYFAAWATAVPASVQQAERLSGVFWSAATRHPTSMPTSTRGRMKSATLARRPRRAGDWWSI